MKNVFFALCAVVATVLMTGCQTTAPSAQSEHARLQMMEAIRNEPPGDYYIGRRYYKEDYKFWGYIRRPGQPWSTARLVMMNEHQKIAPDREAGVLGSDNGVEYRLSGSFSGDMVYEPPSNAIYPEFVLKGYEVISRTPGPIFRYQAAALDPKRRVILAPL